MESKNNPPADGVRWGSKDILRNVQYTNDYPPPEWKRKATKGTRRKIFWIHVEEDGTETKFKFEPWHRPTLRIEQVGNTQKTWTRNFGDLKRDGVTQPVPPRGKGWIFFDGSDAGFCVWTRVVP